MTDWTVSTNLIIEFIRILTITFAGAVLFLILRLLMNWNKLQFQTDRKLRYVALSLYAILAAVQEINQVGEPLVVWRLPVLFAATVCALFGMILPDLREWQQPKPNRRPFEKGMEWPPDPHKRD